MRRKIHAPLALLCCLVGCTAVDPPKHVEQCTQSADCPAPQACDVERQQCSAAQVNTSSQGSDDAAVPLGDMSAAGSGDARDAGDGSKRDAGSGVGRDAGHDREDGPPAADSGAAGAAADSGAAGAAADSGAAGAAGARPSEAGVSGGHSGKAEPASTDAGRCKPEAERCDNLDNDCDMRVDEGMIESCGSSEGECRPGMRSCADGRWSACGGETLPRAEQCDGLDNDCNGQVDDAVRCELHWKRVTANSGPTRREQSAYGYDTDRRLFVIHGGFSDNSGSADTWAFDVATNTWRKLSDTGPSPRRDHAMAYDSAHKRFVLFGGFTGDSGLHDTWELDGQTWIERTADGGPPDRSLHAMVYDTSRQRVVMFGGFSNGAVTAETWEYDGSTWQQRAIPGPPARRSPALTYDSAHNRVLMFGGTPEWGQPKDDTTPGFNDLWAYDGNTWQQLTAASPPRARWFSSLVWHPQRNVAILYGGVQMLTNLTDSYELDDTRWIDRSGSFGSPEFSYSASVIYDPVGNRLLTFGGTTTANQHTDSMWELD